MPFVQQTLEEFFAKINACLAFFVITCDYIDLHRCFFSPQKILLLRSW